MQKNAKKCKKCKNEKVQKNAKIKQRFKGTKKHGHPFIKNK